jgi:tetratricopeptide (TPR) repeat protein
MTASSIKKTKLYKILLFCGLLVVVINPYQSYAKVTIAITNIDDEYDRYKKKADDYFKKGDYLNAKKQYRNCLVVPGFESDQYAIKRISITDECLKLQENATVLMKSEKAKEGKNLLEQILLRNPDDIDTKAKIAIYFKNIGNTNFRNENYLEAKNNYKDALLYDEDKSTLLILIQNCDDKLLIDKDFKEKEVKVKEQNDLEIKEKAAQAIKDKNEAKVDNKLPEIIKQNEQVEKEVVITPIIEMPKKSNNIVSKIIVGLVGAGAGAFSYLTYNQYNTDLAAFNYVNYDPDGDGVINNISNFNAWQSKYNELKTSQKSKQILVYAGIGVSAIAFITETILLIKKPKVKSGLSLNVNKQKMGLVLKYVF